MSDEARIERHGSKLDEHDREILTIKQVVLGPHGSNGLRQDVRTNTEEIRKLRESRGEAQAVAETRRTMIKLGTGVIIAQIAMITLLLRIAEVL